MEQRAATGDVDNVDEMDEIEEAEAVCEELSAALKEAGVKLPSLWLDAPTRTWWAAPLIDLGRCNVETARALAVALRRGAGWDGAAR